MRKISLSMLIVIILMNFVVSISFASMPTENFHNIEALTIPEKDVNLQINNLTRGSEVYLLFPIELLKYSMEKFIRNNIENEFETEKEIAEKVQKLLDKRDYIGYMTLFNNEKYDVAQNAIEFRQYCIALGENKIVDYLDYEGNVYVKIAINLDSNNRYKVILKDYYVDADCSTIKFLIDEFSTLRYINVSDYQLTPNSEKSAISEYNVTIHYVTKEDYDSIEKSINTAYIIIGIIALLTVLLIIRHEIKKMKIRKKEKEEALFYKHDEKKSFIQKLKDKKEEKKNKKKKRR